MRSARGRRSFGAWHWLAYTEPIEVMALSGMAAVVVLLHPGSSRKASANLAREGRFDRLLVESMGISEPLPAAEPRLGRRTALTFPLLPPPQKN